MHNISIVNNTKSQRSFFKIITESIEGECIRTLYLKCFVLIYFCSFVSTVNKDTIQYNTNLSSIGKTALIILEI